MTIPNDTRTFTQRLTPTKLTAAVALGALAATFTACSVVEPVVRFVDGEPPEPIQAQNAPPTQPVEAVRSEGSPHSTTAEQDTEGSMDTAPNSASVAAAETEPAEQEQTVAEGEAQGNAAPEQEQAQVEPQRPRDPFAVGTATAVFPASYPADDSERGVTSASDFAAFGEMPHGGASGNTHHTGYDPTENLAQISFSTEGATFDPVISPDGGFVYFASTRHSPTSDIYVKSVRGTAVTQITSSPAHDVMPAVSPDGSRIAFASNRNGSYDIYVTNADGGQATQVTFDAAQELHPTFSPDGTTVAYCRLGTTTDRWEIWVTEVGKPGTVRFLTFGLFPEWHPTEDRILFQRSRDRGDRYFSVWTVDYVDGEAVAPTEVASSGVAAVINPTWSKDGRFIAFSTIMDPDVNHDAGPEVADLWLVQADGSARVNLTGGHFVNLMPTWGPDNDLFFISNRSGADNIWSVAPRRGLRAAGIDIDNPDVNFANTPVPLNVGE